MTGSFGPCNIYRPPALRVIRAPCLEDAHVGLHDEKADAGRAPPFSPLRALRPSLIVWPGPENANRRDGGFYVSEDGVVWIPAWMFDRRRDPLFRDEPFCEWFAFLDLCRHKTPPEIPFTVESLADKWLWDQDRVTRFLDEWGHRAVPLEYRDE